MRSFATALLAVSANAVKIAGIYEHDHHIVEPYTVTGDHTFFSSAINAVPDGEATVTIRGYSNGPKNLALKFGQNQFNNN